MFFKILKYLSYIFLTYLLLGFFLLPLILKPQLIKLIEQNTKATASLKSLSFNPLVVQLTMEDFTLRDQQKKKLFHFDTLRLNVNPSTLFMGAFELKELAIIHPELYVVQNSDKTFNFTHILKESNAKEEKEDNATFSMPHVIVGSVSMNEGEIFYRDFTRKTPFEFSFENLGFTLKDLDTQKLDHKNADLHFYVTLEDGGFIDLKSAIKSLEPFKVDGSVAFEASKLYSEWKYMQDILLLEVADGKISFSANYAFNAADLKSTKIDRLNLAVNKLRIKPKNKEKDILNLNTLYVNNMSVMPFSQKVEIESLGLFGLDLKAKRYKNGSIDWLEYVKTEEATSKETKKSETNTTQSKPWSVLLNTLALENMKVTFDDEAIRPHVVSRLNRVDLYADNITLLGKEPFSYKLDALINGSAKCLFQGNIVHKKLDLTSSFQCQNLDIVHYRPYIDTAAQKNLKKYDLLLKSALLDFSGAMKFYENNSSYITKVQDTNVSLHKVALQKRTTKRKILAFNAFNINDITLNSATRELNVSKVDLNRLDILLKKYKNETLNIDNLVIAKKTKKEPKKSTKEKPYRVRIQDASLSNAHLLFLDYSLANRQRQTIDRINVDLHKIDSKKQTWLNYKASLRVNKKGYFKASGKLQHTPLEQRGVLRARKLSLREITPYLQQTSYLSIDDGSLSFAINERYKPSKWRPDLRMQGSLGLHSLFVSNSADDNMPIFALNELEMKPFTLEIAPNRLYVDNVVVDSFYVNAKIDENKTLNFSQLMKKKEDVADVSKTAKKKAKTAEKFPVKIVKVDVKNGSAGFEDLSLPIKFKTNIHDLNGVLYALSNNPGDTSYVNIDGEVDKYGSTKLKGSVDSSDPKEYTDLDFNFKNLDLHAMSGYSASFAGYEIDSGKLYLDLGYKIKNAELNATNNIMIKKIKLGKELEGDNINHLPLGFVIGLLEDSDGIIDIDMPIEGNVNQPDFKYGALVWKTLGNLITKAVTSPFKFLGSMMGLDGEELEFVAFEFGKTNITPPQREKLDKIAKLMLKRPKINLQVDATYDVKKDLEALKLQKLIVMVMKKSGAENDKHAKTALTIDVLEDVYKTLKDDDVLDKLQAKLHKKYEGKEYKRAYQDALIKLCINIQNVSSAELEKLAKTRAQAVQNYLVSEKNLAPQRVVFGDVVKVDESDSKVVNMKLDIEVKSKDK